MRVHVEVSSPVSRSVRARQLETMFDVPRAETTERSWDGELPIEERDWNVGLIVGPSGAGKSTILKDAFGGGVFDKPLRWKEPNVLDDFAKHLSMEEISGICQAVGFNTIPAWMRPYGVLSTGEKFRVELARRLLETPSDQIITVDEFTSVVDRQVAKIGAHAVQKWVRRNDRRFVAASCHFDIIDWLQPDWVLEPATMSFEWRHLQPRPPIEVTVGRVPYSAWSLFAPFHYLTKELNRGARCFVLFANDEPAAFCGVLHQPHARSRDIKVFSRVVTLPDWQGLGLVFVLMNRVAASYKAVGYRMHIHPAHPSFIRAFDRSPEWALVHRPGLPTSSGRVARPTNRNTTLGGWWKQGARPSATFAWAGETMALAEARRLLQDAA